VRTSAKGRKRARGSQTEPALAMNGGSRSGDEGASETLGPRRGNTAVRRMDERSTWANSRTREIEIVQEEERRQIAQLLHEGVAQDLAVAIMTLEIAEQRSGRQPHTRASITQTLGSLQRVVLGLRRLTHELWPREIELLNLPEAMEMLAAERSAASGLPIQILHSGNIPDLSLPYKAVFYRAVQEALTNIVRHAHASTVVASVRRNRRHIRVWVDDDGKGISAADLNKPTSIGLAGLQNRFRSLGGSVSIHRRRPKGTRVKLRLPLPEPAGLNE
jgi:signal transduction histidine kinase